MRSNKSIRRDILRQVARASLGSGFLVMGGHAFLAVMSIWMCGTPWSIGLTSGFGSAVMSLVFGALAVEV